MPERAGGVIEFRGQFHAGCSATDNRDADLLVGCGVVHHRPAHAQAVVEQAGTEPVGLHAAVEVEAMLGHPRHAEIVRHRAQRDREDIIADGVSGDQLAPILVLHRRKADGLGRAVDPVETALEEAIAPAIAVAAIADLVEIGVERASSDFMQQRLPDVAEVLVDQNDVVLLAPELRAQPAHQLQPACASADDNNLGLAVHRSLLRATTAQAILDGEEAVTLAAAPLRSKSRQRVVRDYLLHCSINRISGLRQDWFPQARIRPHAPRASFPAT